MNPTTQFDMEPTLGYGQTAEAPSGLVEVMRQNSQAMDEMLATTAVPCSHSSTPKED